MRKITCPQFDGDEGSEGREEVESQSVEEENNCRREQEYQPEPEEQVELLVDDVVRENTDCLQMKHITSCCLLNL